MKNKDKSVLKIKECYIPLSKGTSIEKNKIESKSYIEKKENKSKDIFKTNLMKLPQNSFEENARASPLVTSGDIESKLENNIKVYKSNIKDYSSYDTLVLSGGGLSGIHILGVLDYFISEYKIHNIKNYIGTSVGSIISYLLILDYNPKEIISELITSGIFNKLKYFNIYSIFNYSSVISYDPINNLLVKLTINKLGYLPTMKKLYLHSKKKLVMTTYNFTKMCPEYISEENNPDLPCLIGIRMSCNLPFIFGKFKYNKCEYLDGFIYRNLDIPKAETLGKKVLGIVISANPNIKSKDKDILEFIKYVYNIIKIPLIESEKLIINNRRDNTDIFNIFENKSTLNFNIKKDEIFDNFSYSYNIMKKYHIHLEQIEKSV